MSPSQFSLAALALTPLFAAAAQSTVSLTTAISTTSSTGVATPSGNPAPFSKEVRTNTYISDVKGNVFDRFVSIWLENTDYDKAEGDSNLEDLAKKGITLENFYALTHLSQPNYIGSVSGDVFGLAGDDFRRIPENVSTVVDLLDTRGISWAEYQENMPFTGDQDYNYTDPNDHFVYYVRKHNPLMSFDSIANNETRLGNIKNETLFRQDLKDDNLAQWIFITPNMKNDGHDTSIQYAGNWTKTFLEPLLADKNFMKNTLVLLTFDENHTLSDKNHIYSILLGDAIPKDLQGSKDSTFYTHYSALSTIQANWGLPHLGRNDVNKTVSNVFKFVAEKTNYTNEDVKEENFPDNNHSGPGFLNNFEFAPIPDPDVEAIGAGNKGILDSIAKTYHTTPATTSQNLASATDTPSAPNKTSSAISTSARNLSRGFELGGLVILGTLCGVMIL